MTKTYIELQAEIKELEEQAAHAIAREKPIVANRIKEAIKIYGLTAEDLGFAGRSHERPKLKLVKPKRIKVTAGKSKNPAKYGDDAGNRWSGRGPTPRWLKDHEDQGHSRDQFLIA